MRRRATSIVVLGAIGLLACVACERETRGTNAAPEAAQERSAHAAEPPEAAPATGEGEGSQVLMDRELCEASAAVVVPGDRVWIADNELRDRLFVGRRPEALLGELERVEMPRSKDLGPRDIEALASDGDLLVVVGSHSRNKRCERKPKRQRIRLMTVDGGQLDHIATTETDLEGALASPEACRDTLLAPDSRGGDVLCTVLSAADLDADEDRCGTINIEGAILDGDALWLGLRAPLAKTEALLLAVSVDGLRDGMFQVVDWRRLALEDAGVRELTLDGDTVVGIAGPTLDRDVDHRVFTFGLDLLSSGTPGDSIVAELSVSVPPSSEALVRGAAGWVALIDGAQGDGDEAPCDSPSRQVRVAE